MPGPQLASPGRDVAPVFGSGAASAALRVRCVALVTAALLLSACGSGDDAESRLQQTIEAMEQAAEAGDRRRFLDFVAADFGGQGGRFDRRGLGDLLRVQLLRHSRISATIASTEIQLFEGARASARMRVLLTGGPRAWLPDSGQVYMVETGWRDTDDGWRLISARWEPL